MKTTDNNQRKLKEALFEKIECEGVCPKSKLIFQGKECLVWFLWILSVAVGALAVAVTLFVVNHHQYAFYEATHDNFFTFLVDVLPYVWFVMFGLTIYVSIYNLRHTAHGYRYPVWVILSSSVILSFACGSALQMLGLGYNVDKILGEHMEMYLSQEKLEKKMWQDPDDGRLLGKQVFSTLTPTTTIIFEDMSGQRWRMDVSELEEREVELLTSSETVRLLGKEMNKEAYIFHACGVFPWMMDSEATQDEMNEGRQLFVERVRDHARKVKKEFAFGEEATFASVVLPEESVCATIPPVRKMPIKSET